MFLSFLAEAASTFKADELLPNLVLGALLGAAGQIGRAIIGLKKTSDEATAANQSFAQHFDASQLLVSLLLGAAAGIAASVLLWDKMRTLDQTTVMALLGAGYSGADFLEGFFTKASATAKAQIDKISTVATKLPSLK